MELTPARLLAAASISWCGRYVHNVADLPGQTPFSPETAYPSLISLALVAAHLLRPGRCTLGALLVWALLHLVGGGLLSVLPLDAWPYQPDQSLRHYALHGVYGRRPCVDAGYGSVPRLTPNIRVPLWCWLGCHDPNESYSVSSSWPVRIDEGVHHSVQPLVDLLP